MSRLTVLSWYWIDPDSRAAYTAAHVNIWADMVRRNLSMPHRIACVTDMPEGLDPRIDVIAPPHDFDDWRIPTWRAGRPQCLRRLVMFAPDAARLFGERFVCMDIDCVITGPLDPLFVDDVDFRIFRGTAPGRYYNGSMMMMRAGARPQVFSKLSLDGVIDAGRKFVGSDQAWISLVLGPKEKTWGPEHGVHWWANRAAARANCRVMFFPGSLKPWKVAENGDPLVSTHYHRDPRGRCLVLGHDATVWADASRLLNGGGGFEAVIASPEAAHHWPGPVLAIADDDQHAEQIARMHGFADVAWAGRSSKGVPI